MTFSQSETESLGQFVKQNPYIKCFVLIISAHITEAGFQNLCLVPVEVSLKKQKQICSCFVCGEISSGTHSGVLQIQLLWSPLLRIYRNMELVRV